MSITFTIEGRRHGCDDPFACPECCRLELNVSNVNGLDLLDWLGLSAEYCGEVDASELAARCRRRLWDEPRNLDAGIPASMDGRIILCGRSPGYLRERTSQLLVIADAARAQGARVCWG